MLEFDINVQRQLIEATLDDFCANAALPHVHGGQFGHAPERWRAAVIQFLGDSLAAGLIMVLPTDARYHSMDAVEILRLLKEGDARNRVDADLAWHAIYFAGTENLRAILEGFQLNSWDAMKQEINLPLGSALGRLNVTRL